MHSAKFIFGIFFLSIAADQRLHAEEPDAGPGIVVSASRSVTTAVSNASSIVLISRDEIVNSGARSLPELLKGQPGVHVSDLYGDGSTATVDMRGFGSSAAANTLLMIDGRKLNFASDSGTLYFNSIDLDNVEKVEIVQGSSGVLFGNMAVGGVVNIITRKPHGRIAEVSLGMGSFDAHKEKIRLEAVLGSDWSIRGIFSNRRSDNYRAHNAAKSKSIALLLEKQFQGGRFFTEYEKLDDFLETPGALFLDELAIDRRQSAGVYAADYQDLVSDILRLGYSSHLSEKWILELEASLQQDERDFVTTFRAFPPGSLSTQDRDTINFNPRLVAVLDQYRLTFGVDMQNTDYRLVTAFGTQQVDQLISGLYAQSVISLSDGLETVAGVRYAKIENDIKHGGNFFQLDDELTIGSLALNYYLNDAWRLYARADQNYRFAKVDEHTNPVFLQPVGLENQTGITYELGAEYSGKLSRSGFNFYRLKLDNEISFDASGYSNINLEATDRFGAALHTQLFIGEQWIAGLNYDYVDGEVTAGPFKGKLIPQVPENRLRLFAEFAASDQLTLVLDAVFTDEQVYGGDFNNLYQPMEAYSVFNLTGIFEQQSWSLSWRINNLLDREYAESGSIGNDTVNHLSCLPGTYSGFDCPAQFSAPERNFWLNLKVRL